MIVVEHVTRLRADLRPDWAQPAHPGGSYRVEITGEPSYFVDIVPTSRNGGAPYAAILAAAARIVNSIPDVVGGCAGHPHHAGPAAAHRKGRLHRSAEEASSSPARPTSVHAKLDVRAVGGRLDRRPVGERLHQRRCRGPGCGTPAVLRRSATSP